MELALTVVLASINALIVFVALVEAFGAPPLAVFVGCAWAVTGVFLIGRGLDGSRKP